MNQQNTPFATTICNHGRTTAAGDKEDAGMRGSQPNIPSCLSFGGSRRDKTPRESRSADRDDGTTLCSTPASQSDLDISIFKESRPDRSESEGADLEEKKRSAPARRVRARSILASVFHCTTALFCYPRRSSPSPNHNRVDLVSETGDFGRGTETADEDSDAASLASITSVAIQGTIENGRLYAVFGQQEYGMPMDSAEMDRIGLCHAKYFALLDERRFLAPIGDNPQKILDLGCGTGEWTIDVADMLPSAKIIGVDIAPVQRDWVPPNCHFELDDIEQNWTWEPCSFDYIFARDLLLSVRNWPRLIDQIYHHLKPGGWVELQCISGPITCDDSSLPADGPLREFSDLFATATQCFGTPIDDAKRYAGWLRERGFGSVREHEYKIPCNQWPQGKKLKLVGVFELENLTTGLEGMVIRLFSKTMGWSAQEVQAFLVDVKKDLRSEKIRCYWPYTVVYAQKPRGKTVS